MKRFGGLYAQICDYDNLLKAHKAARRGKGFYKEVQMVDENPKFYLGQIRQMLLNHNYKVGSYSTKTINDRGKVRVLHKLPYYPDRIIQHAILQVIEFIFVRSFCYHTCASLTGRGIKRARILTKRYANLSADKGKYCLKIDIEKFFDNIDKDILCALLARKIKDKELFHLLKIIIFSYPHEKGVPIGSYLSQYFANFYLNEFDHWLKELKKQKYVVRFMDDVVIFGDDKSKLHTLLREIRVFLKENLRLNLKSNFQIFPVKIRGVDFAGYRFFKGFTLLRKRIAQKIKHAFALMRKKAEKGKFIGVHFFCAFNAYAGFFRHFDGFRFFKKHFLAQFSNVARFYFVFICEKIGFEFKFKALMSYLKKVFGVHFNEKFTPKAFKIALNYTQRRRNV